MAGASPALLILAVAAANATIRVGSGAVQTGHRTPLSVVEEFGILDALFPGRVDLGLGRSAGRGRRRWSLSLSPTSASSTSSTVGTGRRTVPSCTPYPERAPGSNPGCSEAAVRTAPWSRGAGSRTETQFVGSPATVAERLGALQAVTDADELLVTTITHRHEDRVASQALHAQEWASRVRVTTG